VCESRKNTSPTPLGQSNPVTVEDRGARIHRTVSIMEPDRRETAGEHNGGSLHRWGEMGQGMGIPGEIT